MPRVLPHQHEQWLAWSDLSSRRQYDGWVGPQPIPVSEIAAWLDLRGLRDQTERELIADTIMELDRAYLSVIADRQKRRSDASKPPPSSRGPKPRRR